MLLVFVGSMIFINFLKEHDEAQQEQRYDVWLLRLFFPFDTFVSAIYESIKFDTVLLGKEDSGDEGSGFERTYILMLT